MSAIKAKNTQAELKIADLLTAMQIEFTAQAKLAGATVDFYLPDYNTAVLVHGCFWHGHDCHLFKVPATRTEFWLAKIEKNRERDKAVATALKDINTRRLIIWECALRARQRLNTADLSERVEEFLLSGQATAQISSRGFEL